MCLYAPINVMPAGGRQGMGWGFVCLCWPWGRAFDWSCSLRGGDIWIFLRPTWRYLTADSDEKDWDRTYISLFQALRMRHTVWKHLEVVEANGWISLFSPQTSFVLAFFWSIEPLKILWYQSKWKKRAAKSIFASTIDQCMAHSLQSL